MTAVAVAVFLLNVSSLAHSCLLHIMQVDDPLDAIAVHAFSGTWGVWAVWFFGAKNLINTSYGYNPYTNGSCNYGRQWSPIGCSDCILHLARRYA